MGNYLLNILEHKQKRRCLLVTWVLRLFVNTHFSFLVEELNESFDKIDFLVTRDVFKLLSAPIEALSQIFLCSSKELAAQSVSFQIPVENASGEDHAIIDKPHTWLRDCFLVVFAIDVLQRYEAMTAT